MMAEQPGPCVHCREPGTTCPDDYLICVNCGSTAPDVATWNRREPGPATAAMLTKLAGIPPYWREMSPSIASNAQVLGELTVADILAFLAEWLEPNAPPAPEQPALFRTLKCNLCGEPVLMSNQAQLFHAHEVANHEAELSNADIKKILRALIDKLN